MSAHFDDVAVEELLFVARQRGLTVGDLTAAVQMIPRRELGRLADHERAVLENIGAHPGKHSRRAVLAGAVRHRQLERQCLTTRQAGDLLGRDPAWIRQRLAGPEPSLLGFHRRTGRREWLLPTFQFELGITDLPGWAQLLRVLPPADATSPQVLVAWLTEPQEHLDGHSRVQLLASTGDAAGLVEEAASFGEVV